MTGIDHRLTFQRLYADCIGGKILNVGAEHDPAGLKERFGAINFDINNFPGIDIVGDATNLPFRDNEFDLVVLGDCLEHIDNWQRAIEEAKRVGKNVIVTVPSYQYETCIRHVSGEKYRYCEHINSFVPLMLLPFFPNLEVFMHVVCPTWIGYLLAWSKK